MGIVEFPVVGDERCFFLFFLFFFECPSYGTTERHRCTASQSGFVQDKADRHRNRYSMEGFEDKNIKKKKEKYFVVQLHLLPAQMIYFFLSSISDEFIGWL